MSGLPAYCELSPLHGKPTPAVRLGMVSDEACQRLSKENSEVLPLPQNLDIEQQSGHHNLDHLLENDD